MSKRWTWRRIAGAVAAGIAGAALPALLMALPQVPPGAGAPPDPSGTPLPPPLVVPGPVPDLDLVFTAQVSGWIEPCG